jgi:hypothetical protein
VQDAVRSEKFRQIMEKSGIHCCYARALLHSRLRPL